MSPCWGSCLQCFGGRPKISAVTGLFVMTWVLQQGRHREVSLLPYWEQGYGKARDAYNGVRPWLHPLSPPPWWDLFSFTGVQSLQSLDPYSDRLVPGLWGGAGCTQLSLSWWQHMGPTPPRNILWRLASLPPRTQDFFFDFISLSHHAWLVPLKIKARG